MVRLAISVEGLTEERFVSQLLIPHLQNYNIYVSVINLNGDVSLPRIKKELNALAAGFDRVTTLYDFYGFKQKAVGETKASLEQKIYEIVAPPLQAKIIPYIQMYEFEGLLFTSPNAIETVIQEKNLARWASNILEQFAGDPEKINDSEQTAPSKRLLSKVKYIKTVHGPRIANEIGLQTLRDKCSGFNDWLTQLEELKN